MTILESKKDTMLDRKFKDYPHPTQFAIVFILLFITGFILTTSTTTPYHYYYGDNNSGKDSEHLTSLPITGPGRATPYSKYSTDSIYPPPKIDGRYGDVLNSTLGFQEIFVISLETRKDRLDSVTVQAGITGLSFRVADGVIGANVPEKALPAGLSRMKTSEIGCWRAHMNVYQTMVRENIQSALILEDDADWDLAIKYQMLDIAHGTRHIMKQTDPNPLSPYGDDWDVIWVGHNSIIEFGETEQPDRWVTSNDPTVIPPSQRHEYPGSYMRYWDDGHHKGEFYTRILVRSSWNEVLTGYAISLQAAMKIIYHQSMLPVDVAIDTGMGRMCESNGSNFTCIAPYPRIIAASTPAGYANRLSDIEGHAGKEPDQVWNDVSSNNLMYSARMNINDMLMGKQSFKSKYGGEVGPEEMLFKDITNIHGHAEVLVPDGLNPEGGPKYRAEVV